LHFRSGTSTTTLLGFHSSGISNQERSVVLHELLLDFSLRVLINVPLMEEKKKSLFSIQKKVANEIIKNCLNIIVFAILLD